MSTKVLSSGSPDELYDTKVREVLVEVDNAERFLVGLRVDVTFRRVEGGPLMGGVESPPDDSDLMPSAVAQPVFLAPGRADRFGQ